MVSQTQILRESQARQRQQRTLQVQRQRDIQAQQRALRGLEPVRKPVAPQLTPQQIATKEYQEKQKATISKLETDKAKYEKQLTQLKKDYDAKGEALSKAGTLTAAVVTRMNQDYLAARRPLLSKVQGYSEAIILAKEKGITDVGQLTSYAMQTADIQEQQRAVAYRIGEIGERREVIKPETMTITDLPATTIKPTKRLEIDTAFSRALMKGGDFTAIQPQRRIEVPKEFSDALMTSQDFSAVSPSQEFVGTTPTQDFMGTGGLDIGNFGMVTAQDLKKKEGLVDYGFSGLDRGISGATGGEYTSISGTQYPVSDDRGFFGRLFSSFKKEEKETFF